MRVISLFSGAGGLDLGLIQAGHEVIWANDNDIDCVETYKKNIGNHIVMDDIESIPSEKIPQGDVVVGGFPCQGFSMANLKRSSKDERNKLYIHFLRIVTEKTPLYFLAENVRGILSLEGGKVIEKILNDFKRAGYRVKYRVFNMADYGVPQTRVRVIIAGTRNDVPEKHDFQFPTPSHAKNPLSLAQKPWVTIKEALSGIPDPDSEGDQPFNHIYSQYKVTNRNFTGHRTTDPNKPSPTILARGNGKGGVCAIQHYSNTRRMTVRESATVQTFPVDYEFSGKMNSMYRQVGNAVPVLFARHLGNQLKKLEDLVECV